MFVVAPLGAEALHAPLQFNSFMNAVTETKVFLLGLCLIYGPASLVPRKREGLAPARLFFQAKEHSPL
jgi:hypothetical protein